MAAEKSDAIVLRVTDFSETSCVVTLLTREFGKITGLAKGARRRKNPFEGAIDVLAICRIVFLRKSSGGLELLTEAKLERRFRGANVEINRAYAGYYVVELLRCLTIEHDPHPELFDLAHEMICKIDEGEFNGQSLVRFELELLSRLGHQPVFSSCATCGESKFGTTSTNVDDRNGNGSPKRLTFSMEEGGIVCQKCRAGKRNIISLSHDATTFLSRMANAADPQQVETVPADDRTCEPAEDYRIGVRSSRPNHPVETGGEYPRGEVRKLMNKYITHLLGYPPRLHSYVNTIE